MSVTYDEMSELSIAFQEAHVPSDRRRSTRIKTRIAGEISEWAGGRTGKTFGVMIEDFSTTGVGIVHTGRLNEGCRYTLEIPRQGQRPIKVLLTVVRCSEMDGGLFSAQLEVSELLAGREPQPRRAGMSKAAQWTLIVVLLGFAAAALAVFADWL